MYKEQHHEDLQNDRGWRADIDWYIKPDTIAKVMEGKYDNRSATDPQPVNGKPRCGVYN